MSRRTIDRILPALLMVMLAAGSAVAAEEYRLDAERSKVQFVGTKPEGKHIGGFERIEGAMSTDGEYITGIAVRVDAASLAADDPKLTQHLLSADFLNVRQFPEASFQTTRLEPNRIVGMLTMHGVTRQIEAPLRVSGTAEAVQIDSQFTIDRNEFGITYGAGKIDRSVTIAVSLTYVK